LASDAPLTRIAFKVDEETKQRVYRLYHRWAADNEEDDSMDAFVSFLCDHSEKGLTSVGVRRFTPDFG